MKREARKQAPTPAVLALIAALLVAIAPLSQASDKTNVPAATPDAQKQYQQALATADKAVEWKDPARVLSEVRYDGLPIAVIAQSLRDQFKDDFDVLLPFQERLGFDWGNEAVSLRLKNVTAGEVFNAMNLLFDAQRTPLRWELLTNGNRPTALLRILPDPPPPMDPTPAPPARVRKIFYVGELLGIRVTNPGHKTLDLTTIDQLAETLLQIYQMSFDGPHNLQMLTHKETELFVVTGTLEEIQFLQEALAALSEKVKHDAQRPQSFQSKPNEEPKAH